MTTIDTATPLVASPVVVKDAILAAHLLSPEIRAGIIARILKSSDSGLQLDVVLDDMSLRENLGLASIDSLELALDLEQDLGVVIEDEELYGLKTVGDVMDIIAVKLASPGQTG